MSLVTFGCASAEIWTSPALPHLRSNNSEFTITSNQGSWIVSVYNVGTILGYLFYPLLVDRIGRKYTLLIFSIPQTLSWIMIIFGKNVIILYLSRIIGGIGYGGAYALQIIYIAEIADKNIRGLLMFISRLFYSFGGCAVLAAGAFLSYDNMNLLLISSPILFFLTFIFMPESPYYYLKRNQEEKAIKTLSRLSGSKDSIFLDLAIQRMKEAIIEDEKNKKNALKILFKNKRQRKALAIVVTLTGSLVFSGSKIIAVYFQDIVDLLDFSLAPQYSALIILSSVSLFCIPTAFLIDFIGRRKMIFCSGIICAVSLTLIGLFFYYKDQSLIKDISTISWIPLIAFIVFDISLIAGLFSTAVALAGELFSSQVKSTALSLLHVGKEPVMFFMKLSFGKLINLLGIYGVLWMNASLCLSLSLIGFFITPETKGKTLEEIQKLLD